jgi:predicted transcriptional regulator
MSTTSPHTYAEMMADLFKLLRTQWLSRPQIAAEMHVAEQTASRWVGELCANGMLLDRVDTKYEGPGSAPMLYTLAPQWGGQA